MTQVFNQALKDSGERKQFETGAVRDSAIGKGRLDLLPPDVLLAMIQDDPTSPPATAFKWMVNFLASPERNRPSLRWAALHMLHHIECVVAGAILPFSTEILAYPNALFELARHYEKGSLKYEARNWEKGINVARFLDSALRHCLQTIRGDTDEPHPVATLWNIVSLDQTLMWIDQGILPASLNDLPVRQNPKSSETIFLGRPAWERTKPWPGQGEPSHKGIPAGAKVTLPAIFSHHQRDAATEAYTLAAEKVYGEYLEKPFEDEDEDALVVPVKFVSVSEDFLSMVHDKAYEKGYNAGHSDCVERIANK